MKKIITAVICIICLSAGTTQNSNATIRRVGWSGTAVAGVDYTTFALAHTAASAGDTIQMYVSLSGSATITKRLVIIGSGYLLSGTGSNANQNIDNGTVSLGIYSGSSIFLSAGSDSSILMGFNGLFAQITNSGKHTIKRNRSAVVYFNPGTAIDKVQVLQNYGVAIVDAGATNVTNLLVSNNIGCYMVMNTILNSSGLVQNNIFTMSGTADFPSTPYGGVGSYLGAKNMLVQNNIFGHFGSAGVPIVSGSVSCVFQNNIFRATSGTADLAAGGNTNTNNIFGANLTSGYFLGTGSNDERFMLAPGSPAIGAGAGGSDCGAFAGGTPYRLSGVPAIPTIYLFTSPDGNIPSTSPMNFTISTKSN